MKNIIRIYLFFTLLFFVPNQLNGQTPSFGNYEVYTRETSMTSFGYLSTTIKLPESLGFQNISQRGVVYGHKYLLSNLGSVAIGYENQINFYLEGNFNLGVGMGEDNLIVFHPSFSSTSVKYYVLTLDVFSLDIVPEYTYVISNGTAITAKLGFNFINVGGTMTFLDKGRFKEHSIGILNLIPFSFKPTIFYDFGRSGIGLSFYINPTNFLSYLIAPRNLYPQNDRGVNTFDSTVKKYAFQILYTF